LYPKIGGGQRQDIKWRQLPTKPPCKDIYDVLIVLVHLLYLLPPMSLNALLLAYQDFLDFCQTSAWSKTKHAKHAEISKRQEELKATLASVDLKHLEKIQDTRKKSSFSDSGTLEVLEDHPLHASSMTTMTPLERTDEFG
jgi:hypothetical protein